MKRAFLTASSCALAALGLVACGGGSSSTTSSRATGPRLTQQEFLAKAQQYCRTAETKVAPTLSAAQKQATANPKNAASIEASWAKNSFVPAARQAIDQIGALNPPADKQDALKKFVDQGHAAMDKIETDPLSVTGATPFPDLATATRDLGLQTCFGGGGGGPPAGD